MIFLVNSGHHKKNESFVATMATSQLTHQLASGKCQLSVVTTLADTNPFKRYLKNLLSGRGCAQIVVGTRPLVG